MAFLGKLAKVKHSEIICVFAVVVFSALYLLPLVANGTVLNPDEGIVLQGAARILRGQVLYRDFFSFYTPGSYYWMALWFRIFGISILVARRLLVAYGVVFSLLTYLLSRRWASRYVSLLVTYLLLVCCLPLRFVALHNWDSTLTALLALYAAVRLLESGQRAWAVVTGLMVSVTVLTEQSKGAGLALGLVLAAALLLWGRWPGWRVVRRTMPELIGGALLPVLLTVAYFASQHSLTAMAAGWIWPLQHYSAANQVPYGFVTLSPENWRELYVQPSWEICALDLFITSPALILSTLPLLLLLAGAFSLIKNRKRPHRHAELLLLSTSVLIGLLLATWKTGRPELHHLDYLAPFCFFLLAWVLSSPGTSVSSLAAMRPLVTVYLLLSFTAFALTLTLPALNARNVLETRHGNLRVPATEEALRYVLAHVPEGAPLLVYPYQPLYSFLTGTFSPTPFEYLQQGMHTAQQFQLTVAELKNHPTAAVLLNPNFTDKIAIAWPSTPAEALAADPVASYLFSEYRTCKILVSQNWPSWPFIYMVPKTTECPEHSSGL